MTAQHMRAEAEPWADRGGRAGLATRGLLYLVVGYIAVRIALGHADDAANKQGALAKVKEQSFGTPLLVLVAVGCAGYALWRFVDALWGKRDEPDQRKRLAKRLGSVVKGGIYVVLLVSTISVIAGSAPKQGEQQQKTWTAKVLGWPGGRVLVAAVGLGIVVAGVIVAVRALRQKFERKFDFSRMSIGVRRATTVLGTAGSTARGVIAVLAGLLLVKAAWDFNANETQGVDGTLRTIALQTYGRVLLLLTAAGLVAFGLYSFLEARYRRM